MVNLYGADAMRWTLVSGMGLGVDVTLDHNDLEKTFAPEYRAQGSTCERMSVGWSGQKLSWRVQCTGPLSMDVAGAYEFDTAQHYKGVITMLGSMAGREMRSRTTLEGERIGECEADDGGQKTEDGK